MSPEVGDSWETPSYFLSICEFLPLSRSKSALPPSHLGIVQINLPSALGLASVQLVALGAFALLLRSLVRVIGISFYLLFAMSFEVRDRWESCFISVKQKAESDTGSANLRTKG